MINPDAFAQLKQLKQEIKASKPIFQGTIKETATKFGFVILDDEREIFLPPDEYQKALPGDRVEVVLINPDEDKPSAEIEKLIKSDVTSLIGRYIVKGKGHFVDAEMGRASRWIFIPPNKRQNAKDGDFVECKLLRHPFKNKGKAQAEVLSILGNESTPGIEESLTIRRYKLSNEWSESVTQQAKELQAQGISKFTSNRADLTDIPFVTIDSSNTQDMDDALYAVTTDSGFTLKVAIADPAALIEVGSPIDQEAQKRATSTYLVDQSIPMMPKELSSDLCSLRPNEERLALIASMNIAESGEVTHLSLEQAVIKSHAKLSYQNVTQFLTSNSLEPANSLEPENNDAIEALSAEIKDSLTTLQSVQKIRANYRPTSVLGDRPDYRIRLNDAKKVDRIERIEKTIAHKIVEEAMVATNHQIACYLRDNNLTSLYINHAGAREDRLEQIKSLAEKNGLTVDEAHLRSPGDYQAILSEANQMDVGFPLAVLINRNMERSEMTLEAKPHVGMALDCYTTATSPIRKYNDLVIHRVLAEHLSLNNGSSSSESSTKEPTAELAQTIYQQQMQSRSAANDLEQWMKCQYANTLNGKEFDAQICGVNSAGFHARIEENGIEGFVATKELKTSFNQELMEHASDEHCFQLQMPIKVKVSGVNFDRKQVNLSLV
jgi:ribonuclease R